MGWFWQQQASQPKAADAQNSAPSTSVSQSGLSNEASSTCTYHDPEIEKLLKAFTDDNPETSESTTSQPTTPPAPSEESCWKSRLSLRSKSIAPSHAPSTRSIASRALSETQLPTTLSCRDAFDYAWHCQSPAGQLIGVYRYGEPPSCSERWADFRFCMRTRSYPQERREEAIKERWRKKEAAKYDGLGKRSSEEVWESRDRPVESGTVWTQRIQLPGEKGIGDFEYHKMEIERRRRVMEAMG